MTTTEKNPRISNKPMLALAREDILACPFEELEILLQRAWDNPSEGVALTQRLGELGLKNIFDRFPPDQKRELASAWDGILIQAAQPSPLA